MANCNGFVRATWSAQAMTTRVKVYHFATAPGLALVRIFDTRGRLRKVFLIDKHNEVQS